MLVIRNVTRHDLPGLKRLAQVLNTVNLPDDERTLNEVVDKSVKSFTGAIKDPFERTYLFVVEEQRSGRIAGTSMIIAQHGTYDAPHVYFEVSEREHYSATIDKHLRHKVLSIGFNYDGPTEIGGLVVDPALRAGEHKIGKQLSFVRFLYIAMHRKLFRDRVLAELLPPLLPDGKSLLWEAYGRKFTGLTYAEADRLSRQNKEFIKELFPNSDVYCTLFPPRVQRIIGKVGPDTQPVQRMLERIGFRYVERIDPFDGGPHFEAVVGDVTLVRKYRRLKLAEEPLVGDAEDWVVAIEGEGKHRFRAVRTHLRIDGDICFMPAEAREAIGATTGDRVHAIPFE